MSLRVLTVCGSLQAASANRAALAVVRDRLEHRGATVEHETGLRAIPPFDSDGLDDPDPAVTAWREHVAAADAVVIAAPEYAGGLAVVVKNALDWLVGSGDLYSRTVAVLSVGSTGGVYARQMLVRTLTWQGALVVAQVG